MILARDFTDIPVGRESHERPTCAIGVAKGPAFGSERVSEWIDAIITAWRNGVAHTLELAGIMLSVRRALPRGGWARLWRDRSMPFSKSKGEMLVVIGARLSWANVQTFAHLPIGWSVLHQLCRLDRRVLEDLIAQGIVHPRITLAEAKLLATKEGRDGAERGNAVARRFRRLQQWVDQTQHTWHADERAFARRKLRELLEAIDNPRVNPVVEPDAPALLKSNHRKTPN